MGEILNQQFSFSIITISSNYISTYPTTSKEFLATGAAVKGSTWYPTVLGSNQAFLKINVYLHCCCSCNACCGEG
jgi:hypothetical protein